MDAPEKNTVFRDFTGFNSYFTVTSHDKKKNKKRYITKRFAISHQLSKKSKDFTTCVVIILKTVKTQQNFTLLEWKA